jgi:hypothetical protein
MAGTSAQSARGAANGVSMGWPLNPLSPRLVSCRCEFDNRLVSVLAFNHVPGVAMTGVLAVHEDRPRPIRRQFDNR